MRTLLRLLAVGAAVSVPAGCAPPGAPEGTPFEDRDTGAPDDVGGLDVSRDGEAVAVDDMAGTWLHYQQISTCVDFGDLHFEQYTRYLYRVDVVEDVRGMIRETWQPCVVEMSPVLSLQPTLNLAVLETSFPVVTGGTVAYRTDVGGEYHSGPVAEVWGIDFDDPVLDDFPAETDDPRIYDSDRDGNPGATLIFGDDICRAFVGNRTVNNHHGTYVAPDRIEGYTISNTQQRVVGSTVSICGQEYITRDNQPRNVFARQRVDGRGGAVDLRDGDGVVTCDAAREVFLDLFDRAPVDDSTCDL